MASALVYIFITAILGRDVLAQLGTSIANDPGDPLFTAALLHWNAHRIPWSDAWWQFPIYYPTRDTLAFSEHLLGLSVVASPIAWITGNPLATYNVTALLTFPLCGMAMYGLVYRLTRSGAAAFVAGLAFAFAPYRMSNLPHIQMLASFWAPLALLGLHGFTSAERVPQLGEPARWASSRADVHSLWWLALYGAAWALQAAANGYALVYFSVLIGLWVLWFAVARGKWRAVGMIAAATAVAALPLAPIVYKYTTVHAYHGFERSVGEMRAYSADVAAVLCAPQSLTFWGWIRVACRAEGELFPGLAMALLFAAAVVYVLKGRRPGSPVVWIRIGLLTIAGVYAAIVASLLLFGPWTIDFGFINISASDLDKPLLVAIFAAVAALVLSLGARVKQPQSTLTFYLFAAVVTWLLALGPTITLMGETSGRPGLFALLQPLPGIGGLRVPARFWLMSVICLTIAAGLFVAKALSGRTRRMAGVSVVVLGCAVLADGWMAPIPARPAPSAVPDPRALQGQVVLQLPIEPYPDIATTWRAVTGGWKTVNGYSGYGPNYYASLALAAKLGDAALFTPFRRDRDLHVVVPDDAATLKRVVERQPAAVLIAQRGGSTQYLLPQLMSPPTPIAGDPIRVTAVQSPCQSDLTARTFDNDDRSLWECRGPADMQVLIVDLGRAIPVGSIEYSLGPYAWNVPSALAIETSVDGSSWTEARRGSILSELIEGGLRDAKSLRAFLPFTPRVARYLRVRPTAQPEEFVWFVADLTVRGP